MPVTIKERKTIAFESEKFERLTRSKGLYEQDIKKDVEMDEFIDVLVKAFLAYRDVRGASESSLLEKLAEK